MSRWYLDENDRDIYWKDDKGLRWNYNTKELVRILNDLETKLRDVEQEQIQEMQEHQEAMQVADKTIKELEATLELHKQSNMVLNDQLNKVTEHLGELEDKLAESESKLRVSNGVVASLKLEYSELEEDYDKQENLLSQILTENSKLQFENNQLKNQLAEKDKEIITLNCVISEIHSDLKELQEFKVGDDEYDLTDSDARFSLECELLNKDQDKISFAVELAVEKLEKVKEYIKTNLMSFQKVPIIQEINNQIKKVREMR